MMINPENAFSIIVPTYREAANIPELIKRIAELDFAPDAFEVLIVDDNSEDGIEELVKELQLQWPWLQLISRKKEKSLSLSALEGFARARFPFLILMDADLSHPPEKIPAMLTALKDPSVDFVLGSRYVQGGSADEEWPMTRKFSSRLAALLAQWLISSRVKDPLSGFFALKKSTFLRSDPLQPVGWKIGLELMLKCHCKQIKEIPIHFSERLYGKSKLNLKVAYEYCCHLKQLFFYKLGRRERRSAEEEIKNELSE